MPLDVRPALSGRYRAGAFIEASREASPFIATATAAAAEIAARAGLMQGEPPPAEDDSAFWAE